MRKSWWLVAFWCALGMFYAISAIGGGLLAPFLAFFSGCFAVATAPSRKSAVARVAPGLVMCQLGLHRWKSILAPPWRMSDGCRAYPVIGKRCKRCGKVRR